MMVNIEKVIQSWNVASEDLNIKFTSDYEVEGYIFIGLVPQFGAQKGMLLWQEFDISMGRRESLKRSSRRFFFENRVDICCWWIPDSALFARYFSTLPLLVLQ